MSNAVTLDRRLNRKVSDFTRVVCVTVRTHLLVCPVYFLPSGGKLSEDEARGYFRQTIQGLQYVHSQGVCHRDLKVLRCTKLCRLCWVVRGGGVFCVALFVESKTLILVCANI